MVSAMKINNLDFKYDDTLVLKDINLNIKKGSFIGILGPNGSGKTTLLKNICNLLKPYNGDIIVDDLNIKNIKHKELAKKLAVVHQFGDFNFDFSVYEAVLMGRYSYLKRFQSESNNDLEVVENAMKETGTWDLREKSIYEISGGERQRVMIARALAQQSEILLLDEPISFLDIKHQINILNLCRRLNKKENLTIIATLHDINLANRYCDLIMLIDSGIIEAIDTPQKVLTAENIKKVYGIDVSLLKDDDGRPYIVPKTY